METMIMMTTSIDILSLGALPNPSTAVLWEIMRNFKVKRGGKEEKRNTRNVERKVYIQCSVKSVGIQKESEGGLGTWLVVVFLTRSLVRGSSNSHHHRSQ